MIQQSKKSRKNAQNAEGVSGCALEISSVEAGKNASKATIGAMVALLRIGADFSVLSRFGCESFDGLIVRGGCNAFRGSISVRR